MTNFEIIKRIISDYKNTIWKTKFYTALFFWIFVSILWLIEPFFFVHVIWYIEQYINWEEVNFTNIIYFIIFWIFFIFFSLIASYIYRYYLTDKPVLYYHNKQFEYWTSHIVSMQYNDYLNKKQGSIYKKFDRWLKDSFNFLFFIFSDLIKNLSWMFIIIIVLFYINYKMAFATLFMLPILMYIWYIFNFKTQKLQHQVNKNWDKSFWYLWDALQNLGLIKTLVLENIFSKKMSSLNMRTISKQEKVSKRWSVADIYTWFIVMISRVIVLSVWFYLVTNWEINFTTLFLFFSFIWYIYFPISFIFRNLRNNQEQISSIRNFFEEFDNLNTDIDTEVKEKLKDIKWNISFNNVSFWYSKNEIILKNINFDVQKWQKVAFVWNTWAWKSTIINLIFRFWDISKWVISIDWININEVNKDSLRSNIWLVMQDNSLFNTTIKENLLFAKKNATIEEINSALKNAEAWFIFKLKDWINTVIWERWLKLSGWEKQRLAIARLFLKNPIILILDEATSALDNKTEKLVQKALDKLMKWRTSIVIAHRLSTIQNADKIFMLEDWKIVEEWNYEELMNKKWKFNELANPEHLILN